jgi:uncharacterized protein YutE (UPF0331/DUF86 family)
LVHRDLARTKLSYIATNLAILDRKKSVTEAEFLIDTDCQYVVLHAMQLGILAAIDLAAHIVADEGWDVPERSGDAFLTLGAKNMLDRELSERLRAMASFRNLIVHEYADVNLKAVFKIWRDSFSDLRQFAARVVSHYRIDSA